MEMLDKIESPTEYINAITKLLPYIVAKKRPNEEQEYVEPITIVFNSKGEEKRSKLLSYSLSYRSQ